MSENCPLCGKPFQPDDDCIMDITEGIVHYADIGPEPECFVNLDTGEPLPASERPVPFKWRDCQ